MKTCDIGIIACEVLRQEVTALLSYDMPCIFMDQNMHNTPEDLHDQLQQTITCMENENENLHAIALVYGLCSKATEGLYTKRCKLVIPRAHDCITLLLGCKKRYADYIESHPGTYWYSSGWIATNTQPGPERYEHTYTEYLKKFDEEDAQYLMETEQSWMREYNRACYIDTISSKRETEEAYTRNCASWLGWECDVLNGDHSLLRSLLYGDWNESEFLVLDPGETAVQTLSEQIITKATT